MRGFAPSDGFYTEVGIDRYKKRFKQVDCFTPSSRAVHMAWEIFDAVQAADEPDYKAIWDNVFARIAFPEMNEIILEFKQLKWGENPVIWLGLEGHVSKRICKHGYLLPGIAGHDSDRFYCKKLSCCPITNPALVKFAHGS